MGFYVRNEPPFLTFHFEVTVFCHYQLFAPQRTETCPSTFYKMSVHFVRPPVRPPLKIAQNRAVRT